MKRRSKPLLRVAARAGTALVLTLFFLLLISALVVALLISMRLDRTNTQSYYQSARVQELANGALEEILSDLQSEIAAGSKQSSVFVVNDEQIFVPTAALASRPARIGFAPGTNGDYATDIDPSNVKLPPTVVRVSRAGYDVNAAFPASVYDQTKIPPGRASAVSTTNYSANGRTISPKRWNSSFLLSGTTTPPARFTNNVPDWIYLTRGGSRVITDADVPNLKPTADLDNTNTVVGRYSYVVYDGGGLIDVNAAGFPSDITATNSALRGKSSIIYAALTSLPGLTSSNVDGMLQWRSAGSIGALNATNFLKATTNWMSSGFLSATNGDSPFLGRRDLINYFTSKIGNTQALPYLGTFSRYLAAPSVRPATPSSVTAGTQYDYDAKADVSGTSSPVANRDLANVRFSQDATVAHYSDDPTASPKTYQAKQGDPLLQSRFSLARLGWLEKYSNADTGSGPSAGSNEGNAIKACFGLVWGPPGGTGAGTTANGGRNCWNYVGAKGDISNPPGIIKTLAEVAAEGREPDFFELLKAAILSGSLGLGPGPAAFNNGTTPNLMYKDQEFSASMGGTNNTTAHFGLYGDVVGPIGSTTPAPPRISDMQIIKIGANIIDQYDADGWPTAIYFRYAGITNGLNLDPASGSAYALPIYGPVTMVYGTENLPYLAFVRQLNASLGRPSPTTPVPGTDLAVNSMSGWLQPFLWNPHQPPSQVSPNRPSNFQIRAYGTDIKIRWNYAGPPSDTSKYNLTTYSDGISEGVDYYEKNDNTETCDIATLNFIDSGSNTSPYYGKPYPLLLGNAPAPLQPDPRSYGSNDPNIAYYNDNISAYGVPNHFVAFSTGKTPDPGGAYPYAPFYILDIGTPTPPGATFATWSEMAAVTNRPDFAAPPITYALGWKDSLNRFHPYSYLTGAFASQGIKLSQNTPDRKVGSADPDNLNADTWSLSDPRTERFSLSLAYRGAMSSEVTVYTDINGRDTSTGGSGIYWYGPPQGRPAGTFVQSYRFASPDQFFPGDYMVNSATTGVEYYRDPDGVVRPADGFYGNKNTGDGKMTFTSQPTGSLAAGDNVAKTHGRVPVILDRPFRSVAELGYAFRDEPFKTLDFFSDKSADSALLDVFCLNDVATVTPNGLLPVAAGRVNPNAASTTVLKALLKGGAKKEYDTSYNLQNEVDSLASTITSQVMSSSTPAPLNGYRDLIPALTAAVRNSTAVPAADKANKAYLEGPIRALSESTDFRTWNLIIDLVAQSGGFAPNAARAGNFMVQAECRVWLHIAIDRYTGKVIARQIEPVYE